MPKTYGNKAPDGNAAARMIGWLSAGLAVYMFLTGLRFLGALGVI